MVTDQAIGAETETEDCWRAVLERDSRLNESFVYAVRTTGVYCRPTCPSRRPLRVNVLFFRRGESARAAGYRPCKRCDPDGAAHDDRSVTLVHAASKILDDATDDRVTVGAVAEQLGVSTHALRRAFLRVLGVTAGQFAGARRLERLKSGLRKGQDVTSTLYEAGYGSTSRLYEHAGENMGMTPGQYRRGGMGAVITYTIIDSVLGRLLVAATTRGVCRISVADHDDALEDALEREFPLAERHRNDNLLGAWAGAILGRVNGLRPAGDLPLDVQGTAFQRRVWDALRTIPAGETRTYAQVANAIGQPKAVRAVANACAANPVPIVVPCHRVVRTDGGLGGYALGTGRKQTLLRQEGARE